MGIHSVRGRDLPRRRRTQSKREYINSNSRTECGIGRRSHNWTSNLFLRQLRLWKRREIHDNDSRGCVSIRTELSRTRDDQPDPDTKSHHRKKRDRHNKYVYPVIAALLSVQTLPARAEVGGVSATANPIANSSGSVTNQAIQVLQGPYITNTYGGGIQCQGATLNMTPFATGAASVQRPFERYYDDPVYDIHDADDDGQIDNPGNILYYVPTRTGQTDSYNLSVGVSATWSKPLDKELQELCKAAALTHDEAVQQNTANKRLDFEIARLKNCGTLMKEGIIFKPGSTYAKVCEDVQLINPVGVVANHTHTIDVTTSSSEEKDLSSDDIDSQESQNEKVSKGSSLMSFEWLRSLFSPKVSPPLEEHQQEVLLIEPMSLP